MEAITWHPATQHGLRFIGPAERVEGDVSMIGRPVVDAAFAATLESFVDEARAANGEILAAGPAVPVDLEESRRRASEGGGIFPAKVRLAVATERVAPGLPGQPDVPVRLLVPEHVDGAYLFIHGGGWAVGGRDQWDEALWALARTARVAVVSVGYRLVPEHPFPAGPDDCEAAGVWLAEHGPSALGTDRLVIGGGSAGAHLAALTLLRLRDRHDMARRFCGANLVYGVYDLGRTPSQRAMSATPIMDSSHMEPMYQRLLPGLDPEQRRDPAISPLYADLRELPPALFSIGTLDPLLDDSLFMAERWAMAGNYARLDIYPDSPHGFTILPTKMAAAFVAREQEFLVDAVQGRLD
jgi:acetyl esterase